MDRRSDYQTSAFVGSAGTGKSQRAQLVASLVDADHIIDDGLVVHKGSIVCGKSAKSERNQISAIRRALFEFDDHRQEVVDYFNNIGPCGIMVIATSEGMAARILRKLGLPPASQVIHIEDVATPEEILKAQRERYSKGQHVIPVSHVLVRKNFAGKLVGQLRVFWRSKEKSEGEKTIVRPPFSFKGDVHIEKEALEELASFIATGTPQVASIKKIEINTHDEAALSVDLDIVATLGNKKLEEVANLVRQRTAVSMRYFTGLDVKRISVKIAGVEI
ncbi:MAG: Asp23/Gls24 family envelope stress response protein [Synergistes sp.]|nr:Asp23/Gls24 family envelope stress response protein [Synergistes sp.]